jgi:hypothetical protein
MNSTARRGVVLDDPPPSKPTGLMLTILRWVEQGCSPSINASVYNDAIHRCVARGLLDLDTGRLAMTDKGREALEA